MYHNDLLKVSLVKLIVKTPILTTSVFVILASNSVRFSPHSERLVLLSCRPQIAAAMLPVAIMDGGYMAKVKSEERANQALRSVSLRVHKHVLYQTFLQYFE